jgi:primosomal protein N' (replication factor Y)
VQTRNPEHPAVAFASRHDLLGFVERELLDREELGYPPFARLAMLRIDGDDEASTRAAADELAARAQESVPAKARLVQVLGPAVAPLARLRGRYRFQVLLRAKERGPLRAVLVSVLPLRERLLARVRVAIDVDPVQMM